MYKYQNVTDQLQVVVGVGEVEAGAEVAVERPLENPNFKYLGKVGDDKGIIGTAQRQPNAVTEGEKVDEKESE